MYEFVPGLTGLLGCFVARQQQQQQQVNEGKLHKLIWYPHGGAFLTVIVWENVPRVIGMFTAVGGFTRKRVVIKGASGWSETIEHSHRGWRSAAGIDPPQETVTSRGAVVTRETRRAAT